VDVADLAPGGADAVEEAVGSEPWARNVSRRLVGLAAARVVAQGLGLVWFVVAARLLTPDEFGILSGALAVMVVLGGLSDLGTTRGVVRHVAGDTELLWPVLRRALELRVAAGVVVGVVCTVLVWLTPMALPAGAAALAAWIAVASGANELGYAALRAVGRVRTEMVLLVLERSLFTASACAALALGAGPFVALAVYGATNTLTAVLATMVAHHRGRGVDRPAPPMLDAEGRHTAVASSLVIIAPRISSVLLVVLSTSTAVGAFAVAQKPTEALSLLAVAMLVPVLPLLRSRVLVGAPADAVASGARVTAAVLCVVGPVVAWLVVDNEAVIRILFGATERPGASTSLVLLAIAALGVILRSLGELLLLASERAARYLRAVGVGMAVALVAGIALVPDHGAIGAAWSTLAGEVVAVVLVVAALPMLRTAAACRPFAAPVVLGLAAAAVLVATQGLGDRASVAITIAFGLAGLALARHPMREIDRPEPTTNVRELFG
jgi:O-antigen/teichoic acid export membrane protein